MYVCVCVGITDHEIVDEIKKGNNTIQSLMMELGVGLGCGMCHEELEAIVIQENKCGYQLQKIPSLFYIVKPY